MRARTVNIGAGGRKWGCRLLGSEGSVVDEFREVVLNWRIGVEDEDGVGVERDFLSLPVIGGFR
jgi:hypothetical protein